MDVIEPKRVKLERESARSAHLPAARRRGGRPFVRLMTGPVGAGPGRSAWGRDRRAQDSQRLLASSRATSSQTRIAWATVRQCRFSAVSLNWW